MFLGKLLRRGPPSYSQHSRTLVCHNGIVLLRVYIAKFGYSTQIASKTPESKQPKVGLMKKLKDGAAHYWHGSKLLALETKISFGIMKKLLRGEKLIRREYRQLLRTSSDLVRLIPLIIIAIVPFLEFALPILLKFFPNMLPSTFEDKFQAEEKVKKQLKIKLETAKFLQDMAENLSRGDSKINELSTLFHKARTAGDSLTADEFIGASKHLHGTVQLENLGRTELLSLCRYMGLNAFGTDNFLRFQIRNAINKLKADDQLISQEGVDSLTSEELKSACHARGIRTINAPEFYMRRELQQWVDLQLKHSVPAPLLILSRALALSDSIPLKEGLKDAVESLGGPILEDAPATVKAQEETLSPKEKIKVIKEQQELIDSELEAADRKASVSDKLPSTTEEIGTISEAVAALTSASPTVNEREDLAELKQDLSDLNSSGTSTPQVQAIGSQVNKLIADIEKQIADFESEIGKRLQVIHPAEDGTISVSQLQAILQFIKNSPKDSEKIREIIQAFDKDGDGKIFIKDILEIAHRNDHKDAK